MAMKSAPPRDDLDGNLLSDGRWTYSWDGENRLVKRVSTASPVSAHFAINALNRFYQRRRGLAGGQ